MILMQTGTKENFIFLSDPSSEKRIFTTTIKGTNSVTDDTGDTWYWNIKELSSIFDIISVIATKNYSKVDSFSELENNQKTYFIDGNELSIHFDNDYEFFNFSNVASTLFVRGLTDNVSRETDNYYNNFFYDPICKFGSVSKKINNLKSGLIPLSSLTFDVTRFQENAIADFGSQVIVVDQDLNKLYEGLVTRKSKDRTIEKYTSDFVKFFTTSPVCPNVFDKDELIDDKYVGKNIPVAYGNINKGICVPIDSSSFDDEVGGSVTFLVADYSLGSVTINKVFDSNDNEISFSLLGGNRFSLNIDANADFDLDKVKWQGVGYGSITTGLDVIKEVLEVQGDYAYNSNNFDVTAWNAANTALNYSVGLSIQSSDDILSSIIEPISQSLYGSINILNDGRLTFVYSDSTKTPVGNVLLSKRIGNATKREDLKDISSIVDYIYNNDYVESKFSYSYIDRSKEVFVNNNYGIKSKRRYNTVLSSNSDIEKLRDRLNIITGQIQINWDITTTMQAISWELYDVVNVETGTILDSDVKKTEIIGKTIDFDKKQIKLVCREV